MRPSKIDVKHPSIIGFDYGTRRIGVAVGNIHLRSTLGLGVVQVKQGKPNEQQLERYVHNWQPHQFVVGVPTAKDGRKSKLQHEITRFGNLLNQKFKLPVKFVNEELSTEAAISRMSRRPQCVKKMNKTNIRNQIAAEIILETYFSSQT